MSTSAPILSMSRGARTGSTPATNNASTYGSTPYTTGNQLFDNMPAPGYAQAFDPNTMSMEDYLKSISGNYTQGYDEFKRQALDKGPSQWLNMNLLKNRTEEQGQRENAQREANASTAGALDKLAAQGGLSSGARERAVEGGSKNYLGMSQDISRTSNLNEMGFGIQDQTNKIGMLSQLPGMELGRQQEWEKARAADVDNQQKEVQRLNQYNMDLYSKRMEAAAAERQARATASSGKK